MHELTYEEGKNICGNMLFHKNSVIIIFILPFSFTIEIEFEGFHFVLLYHL